MSGGIVEAPAGRIAKIDRMPEIDRISRTRHALPALRRTEEAPRAKRDNPAPLPHAVRASHAGLGRLDLTGTRPVAAFLAQYIDQHWPRERSPNRKAEKRGRATSAYIGADMLPDLLAETLRPRLHDRKF